MKIIKAKEKHLEEIVKLCKDHATYEKASYEEEGKLEGLKEHLFKENPEVQCLLVEVDHNIAGYATFIKQFATWDADYYLYLDCIYLKEAYRGMGLGALLMQEVKKFAVTEKCLRVEWHTPDFNVDAIRFYKRLGATAKPKERFFWNL